MLHLAQLRAHWGSCGKFWEPGGTKALIYLYDRENTARSKLVQIMWGNKRKRSLRTQILQMVETTARGRNTPRYRFMAQIKYARGSRDIHLTLRRAVTWSEWWMPPVIFRQSAGGVSLKQGTSSLITLVKLLICHQLMMRWAGTSKKLRWRALSVWMCGGHSYQRGERLASHDEEFKHQGRQWRGSSSAVPRSLNYPHLAPTLDFRLSERRSASPRHVSLVFPPGCRWHCSANYS